MANLKTPQRLLSQRHSVRFESLYREHVSAISAFARRQTGAGEAEDVVMDVFLVAWRRLDVVPEGDAARRWLYSVARRVVANHRRSAVRRSRLVDCLGAAPVRLVAEPEVLSSPLDVLDAFTRLCPADQEVLRLAAREDITYADVGVLLGLSEAAVTSRVHRARGRLAERL